MKKFSKVFMGIICCSLFMAFALGSGSGKDSSAEKVGEVNQSATTTNEAKEKFYVGETFSKDGLSVTYVSSGVYESSNQFIQPAEGKKYIRLAMHVDNQSGSDKSVSSYSFKCYADGYNCDSHYFDDDLSASLSNGRSADGALYYEIPVDAKEVEIEFDYSWLSDKKVKFIYEGNKDSGLTFDNNTSANESAFHVGDIIKTKNLNITYNKASRYVSDNIFMQPDDGNKYIYIELEVENLSNSDQSISYFSFQCYADGKLCDGFYGLDDELSATLSSGRKAKGTVGFEVPENAKVIEIEFEDNLWTDSKIIFLYEEK